MNPEVTEPQRVVNEYRLSEDNELRIETADEEVIIELLEGTAEIFGTVTPIHKRYTLPPGKSNLFYLKIVETDFLRFPNGNFHISKCIN